MYSFLCQIDQNEFTDIARQAVVGRPEVAKESKHQIADTKHLMKALLEQRNGVDQHMFVKANVDNTELLQAPERFRQTQPEVRVNFNVFLCMLSTIL
jgi:ATP-dependent Clp protease ATP-binding subunit ClpB